LVAKNSDADANTSTLSPTERIRLLMAARTDASSSMTKTAGGTFAAVVLVVNSRISLGKASTRSAARMRSAGLAEERNESSFLGLPDTLFPRVKFERPNGAPQGLGLGNAGAQIGPIRHIPQGAECDRTGRYLLGGTNPRGRGCRGGTGVPRSA
jgi:hypothetical protein